MRPLPVQYAEYLTLRGVAGLLQCFDVDANLRTAAAVGSTFYRLNHKRRERAEADLARCFPEWDAQRVRATAERSMQYMFQLFMVDALMAQRLITPSSWTRRLHFGDLGPALERLITGRPTIFVTGHCGNWELLGHALAVLGYPLAALARPLDNRYLNRWLLGMRESRGMRIITKWGATPVIERILAEGGSLGFIADQNAGDGGLFVPFFGRLASSYKSIGLLAMRHDIPIAAGLARRLNGRMEYEVSVVDFIEPADWAGQPDPLYYITARFNRAIETMIRAVPDQYLWLHRRWKSRPRHERLHRPMPARLREKIGALPWITDADMEAMSNGATP